MANPKQYWGEAHNEKRRSRYQTDPEYREKARAMRRESYAKATGTEKAETNCLSNLDKIDSAGSLKAVRLGGSPFVIGRVYTQADLCKMIDRQPQVLYRWLQNETFPRPILEDDSGNAFYADDEVRAFVQIMGEHQRITPYYRADHDEVRQQLFAASFRANKPLGEAWINTRP